ncbi:MAG: glycosyltransferase family 2 protein [Spirochaetota bacterium]|nr:glycosyltransferase family 2 protein [Spirochaetota bacterium]
MQISIIIPVYNTEKYLPKCLESVINQTYKDIEIIVVNDCSSGNCEEIVKSYQEQDDRIIYLKHHVNKGLFGARETGVKKSSYEYILHVDSDDWIELDICEKLQESINYSPDLIEFGFQIIDDSLQEPDMPKIDLLQCSQQELFTRFITLQNEPWFVWRYLLKRDIALKVYEELQIKDHIIIHEDVLFLISYSYYITKAISVAVVGYNYNWNNMNSAMREKRTVEVLQKELNVTSVVISHLEHFFDIHQLDNKLLFHIKYNLCKSFLGNLQFYERDQKTMNSIMDSILKQSIDIFGSDIFTLFIVAKPELLPNWIRTLLKIQDQFFPKDQALFKVLKKIYYKIKRLKK